MRLNAEQPDFKHLVLTRRGNVYIVRLNKPAENRLSTLICSEVINALHYIRRTLGPDSPGAVVTAGSDAKFWSTGLDLDEVESDPFANTDGFFPMLHAILDFPFPTVACLTGHVFGGAVLSHWRMIIG